MCHCEIIVIWGEDEGAYKHTGNESWQSGVGSSMQILEEKFGGGGGGGGKQPLGEQDKRIC